MVESMDKSPQVMSHIIGNKISCKGQVQSRDVCSHHSFPTRAGRPCQDDKTRKEGGRNTDWGGRNETVFVLKSHDCLYRKFKTFCKKKFLGLTSDHRKTEGYKVYIQKSITFLYSCNAQIELHIKNTISFTLAPQKVKA